MPDLSQVWDTARRTALEIFGPRAVMLTGGCPDCPAMEVIHRGTAIVVHHPQCPTHPFPYAESSADG